MCARTVDRSSRDRYSQFLSAAWVAAASLGVVCGGTVSIRFSKACGGAVLCWGGGGSRAQYLTVSMMDQKKATDSKYSMGIDKWNPTSCYSSSVALGTRNAI